MAEVTCPRCGTRQPIGDAAVAYTCAECGETWAFVTCDNCAVRFHMRPGTADWTCPECGHEHGSATMGQFEPEPEHEPEPEAGPEPEPEWSPAPIDTAPAPVSTPHGRRPLTRTRLAVFAIVGVIAVPAIAVALWSLGGGETGASSSISPSPLPSASVDSTEALCLHLRELQTPREDALTRLAATLKADAVTFKAEGDFELAVDVLAMRKAVLAYVEVLAAQGDITDVATQMASALSAMPC
jgi:ribosomal protein L37AE/L43A